MLWRFCKILTALLLLSPYCATRSNLAVRDAHAASLTALTSRQVLADGVRWGTAYAHPTIDAARVDPELMNVIEATLIAENRWSPYALKSLRESAEVTSGCIAAAKPPDEICVSANLEQRLVEAFQSPATLNRYQAFQQVSYDYADNLPDMMRLVTLHEIGHLRWFQGLSETFPADFTNVRLYPACTAYSEQSAGEKFAEYYALYRYDPRALDSAVGTIASDRFAAELRKELDKQP